VPTFQFSIFRAEIGIQHEDGSSIFLRNIGVNILA